MPIQNHHHQHAFAFIPFWRQKGSRLQGRSSDLSPAFSIHPIPRSRYIHTTTSLAHWYTAGLYGTLWLHPRCISRNLSHIKMTINIEGVSAPSFSLSIHGHSCILVMSWVVGDPSFSLPSISVVPPSTGTRDDRDNTSSCNLICDCRWELNYSADEVFFFTFHILTHSPRSTLISSRPIVTRPKAPSIITMQPAREKKKRKEKKKITSDMFRRL